MYAILQNRRTLEFADSEGRWTPERKRALRFHSGCAALEFRLNHDLHESQVLFEFLVTKHNAVAHSVPDPSAGPAEPSGSTAASDSVEPETARTRDPWYEAWYSGSDFRPGAKMVASWAALP